MQRGSQVLPRYLITDTFGLSGRAVSFGGGQFKLHLHLIWWSVLIRSKWLLARYELRDDGSVKLDSSMARFGKHLFENGPPNRR